MGAFGYLFIILGGLFIRQVMVGRTKQFPSDMRDLFVSFVSADVNGVETVLSARGENTNGDGTSVAGSVPIGPTNQIGQKAINWGLQQEGKSTDPNGRSWYNRCLAFVQFCYTEGAGITQQSRGTAANAARTAKYMHRDNVADIKPGGVPIYWGGGQGHVVLSLGNGNAVGTDYPTKGSIGVASVDAINKWLGSSHPYIGWSEDSCGTKVYGNG